MTKIILSLIILALITVQAADAVFEKSVADLLEWMKHQKAEFVDVELRQSRENLMRGVYAKRDIAKGEKLVFVPYDALIERDKVYRDTEIGKKLVEIKDEYLVGAKSLWYESVDLLAIMLLEQKSLGQDSHYFHFINNFPAVDDFPITYGDNERELLKGSPFLKRLDAVKANYIEDYNILVEAVPELS